MRPRRTPITPIALHLRPGVREHYLAWLREARPDLVSMYDRRFGRRSYQPEAEQRRLREVVDVTLGRGKPQHGEKSTSGRHERPYTTGRESPEGGAVHRSGAAVNGAARRAGCPNGPEESEVQLRLF